MELKVCKKCGQELSLDNFYSQKIMRKYIIEMYVKIVIITR